VPRPSAEAVAAPHLPPQRHLFDIPGDVAFFNFCSQSPLLRSAAEAGAAGLARKLRPWEVPLGDHFAVPEAARRPVARLIGAVAADIAVVPAVSYGIAVAAANLPLAAGQRIVVLEGQFLSNLLPWQDLARRCGGRVVEVPRPAERPWTEAVLEAIDADTAIVALPNLLWTDGTRIDLAAVARRARAVGAALVLDLAQSLGALPFDVGEVDPDFMVGITYKWLLGPYTLGFLYVAPRRQAGRPLEPGFLLRAEEPQMRRALGWQGGVPLGARRFDMGEAANFALLPAATAALEQILEWGVPAIQASLGRIMARLLPELAELGLAPVPRPDERAGHLLGFRLPPGAPADLAARLAQRGVHASVRAGILRIAPHLSVTPEDERRLVDGLKATLSPS